jgi:hypothetical protein
VQEFEAFGANFSLKHGHPRDVAAGSGEARDMTGLDRICMGEEDDGNRGCRCFQGSREDRAPRCDQIRLEPDQFSRHFREPSDVALNPPGLDSNVHALLPAVLPQTLPKGLPGKDLVRVCGFVSQDADAVNLSWLLRADGERRGENAPAHQGDERSPVNH